MAEVISPLDVEDIEMECTLHGRQHAVGEVEGMVLYWSCPVTGCPEPEDSMDMEVVR